MDQEIYLTGLLIPVDWSGNGSVKAVALATADEKEIPIGGPLQTNIIGHLRQQVALWGTFEDPIGRTVFNVNRFLLVPPHSLE
jgi:hypothetical protein